MKVKLDKIFSIYIRLRDSDENGHGRCISCGKFIHYKDGDAGHYVSRKNLGLRYDEKNVNLQCVECNRFNEGNMIGYNHGLVEKYGEGVISYLNSHIHNICKIGKSEYNESIKYYQKRVNELKKQKNIN